MTVELRTTYLPEIRVGLDKETFFILDSNPHTLLNKLFENDPDRVFLLENTGFDMSMQALRWITKYKSALEKNSSLQEVNDEFKDETIQDVLGFYFEYLTKQDIFPIPVEIGLNKDGKRDVMATKYNQSLKEVNENLAIITGQIEREGALENGVDKTVDIILESGPNTVVVLNSPAGWSGLTRNGEKIIYPDNQTYVYYIDSDNNLNGFTIRTDISLESGEKLTEQSVATELGEKERIKRVVSKPISKSVTSIDEIINLIEEVSGKKFPKQRNELRNKDKLFVLNDQAERIVDDLKKSLKRDVSHLSLENIKKFVVTVGKSILDLYNQTLVDVTEKTVTTTQRSNDYQVSYYRGHSNDIHRFDYRQLAYKVSQIPGCNGGGNVNNALSSSTSIGNLLDQTMITESAKFCPNCGTKLVCGHCKKCNKIVVKM